MPFFVEFSCGCRVEHNECYRVHDRGLRMCHAHREATIDKMVFVCEICGEESPVEKLQTTAKKYCSDKCVATAKLSYKYVKGSNKNRIPTPEPIPKPDCKHYLNRCLLQICKNPHEKAVRCNFCPRYEKDEMDIMEYECGTGNDNFVNYNYIPIDFNKHATKIIRHNEKQAGKKPLSDKQAKTSYLWGYQHNGRKPALERAKERVNADK